MGLFELSMGLSHVYLVFKIVVSNEGTCGHVVYTRLILGAFIFGIEVLDFSFLKK